MNFDISLRDSLISRHIKQGYRKVLKFHICDWVQSSYGAGGIVETGLKVIRHVLGKLEVLLALNFSQVIPIYFSIERQKIVS